MCPVYAHDIQMEMLQSESPNMSLAWIQWFYMDDKEKILTQCLDPVNWSLIKITCNYHEGV